MLYAILIFVQFEIARVREKEDPAGEEEGDGCLADETNKDLEFIRE